MRSEVISKPVITEYDDKEMILYWPYQKSNSFVIFSSDGICYQENWYSHFTLNPYVSLIESLRKNKKAFSKREEGLHEFLFEFDKIYVYLDDTYHDCIIFSFNRSMDSDPIFTEVNLKELKVVETTNTILSYDELKDFLYAIEDPCDEEFWDKPFDKDSIISKFVYSTILRYANCASSDLVYKKSFEEIGREYIMQELKHFDITKIALDVIANDDFFEESDEESIEEREEENVNETSLSKDCFTERILQTLKENCDSDDENLDGIPKGIEFSEEKPTNNERLFPLISGEDNFRIIVKYSGEIEIGKFYMYCLGEDSFELEYQKLHIGKMDEIKEIFSALKVK